MMWITITIVIIEIMKKKKKKKGKTRKKKFLVTEKIKEICWRSIATWVLEESVCGVVKDDLS